MHTRRSFLLSLLLHSALASVTIYTDVPGLTPTSTINSAAAAFTGAAAYDPTELIAPAVPSPAVPTTLGLQLFSGGMNGLSIPHTGAFAGFSIELSVANQIFGKNASIIHPIFLNLMGNIKARAGRVQIRLGGNSQEKATFHPEGLPNNTVSTKHVTGDFTPTLDIGIEMLYVMSNITQLTNTQWIVGYPFANINPPQNSIVESSLQVEPLASNILGFQLGNEPDRYATTQYRAQGYAPQDYNNDFGNVVKSLEADSTIGTRKSYIGGSLCCNWTPENLWDTGFLTTYASKLSAVAMEHYPQSNCGGGDSAQDLFAGYLTHNAATSFIAPYTNTANLAQGMNLPFYITETNTASCSGYKGISNSFGGAMWGIDHMLNMAAHNLSAGFFHSGGQDSFYNSFTPPPTNQSTFRQWTIGAVYYSSLIVAEVLGASNASQIIDLTQNQYAPAYAIYENGTPTRVALFNFVTDPSGASDYTANIWVGGSGANQPNASPSQLSVRRFTSPNNTVSDIGSFSWANQTFGASFESDGRLNGTRNTETIQCDASLNQCSVQVKAPSFVLVFLSDQALQNSEVVPEESATFATTVQTKLHNTVTVDQAVLATSNGHGGKMQGLGVTSPGSYSAAGRLMPSVLVALLASTVGAVFVMSRR